MWKYPSISPLIKHETTYIYHVPRKKLKFERPTACLRFLLLVRLVVCCYPICPSTQNIHALQRVSARTQHTICAIIYNTSAQNNHRYSMYVQLAFSFQSPLTHYFLFPWNVLSTGQGEEKGKGPVHQTVVNITLILTVSQ